MSGKSIFDKLWERHVVTGNEGEPQLMYVDQHYIHEVTSPQAFQGLRDAGRKVRRPDLTFGTTDHNVPTVDIFNIRDLISKNQIDTLRKTLKNLVLMRLPTVLLVRGLSTWLVLKQVVVNQENLSFVEIVIRLTHGALWCNCLWYWYI